MNIAFYLKRVNSITETAIYARISYKADRIDKYYISEKINPKYWNKETQRAKQSRDFPEFPEFNTRIDFIESKIKSIYRKYLNENNNRHPEHTDFKMLLDRELKDIAPVKEKLYTFFGFFDHFIEARENGSILKAKNARKFDKATIQIYKNTHNRLKAFELKRNKLIDFNKIDIDFYNEFMAHLTQDLNLSTNTIGKDIKTLKTVLNDASDRGYNTNMAFKSKSFITPTEESDSIYLDRSEILEMTNLDLTGNPDLDNARYLFLIGCYTGLRYSDLNKLTLDHFKGDDFIEIKLHKTENPIIIPRRRELIKLIDTHKGILPTHLGNSTMNLLLKEIGKLMPSLQVIQHSTITKGGMKIEENKKKWEHLESHTARRSFATNEFLEGTDPIVIMAITNHTKIEALKRYIKIKARDKAIILKANWDKRDLQVV
jgi:integrase